MKNKLHSLHKFMIVIAILQTNSITMAMLSNVSSQSSTIAKAALPAAAAMMPSMIRQLSGTVDNNDPSQQNNFSAKTNYNFSPKVNNKMNQPPQLNAHRGFGQPRRSYSTFAPKSNNPYDILGISRDATKEEAKAARHKLLKQYHTDINPNNKQEATLASQMINNAYDDILAQQKNPNAYKKEKQAKQNHKDEDDEDIIIDKNGKKYTYNAKSDYDHMYGEVKAWNGWRLQEKCYYNPKNSNDPSYLTEDIVIHPNGTIIGRAYKNGRIIITKTIFPDGSGIKRCYNNPNSKKSTSGAYFDKNGMEQPINFNNIPLLKLLKLEWDYYVNNPFNN